MLPQQLLGLPDQLAMLAQPEVKVMSDLLVQQALKAFKAFKAFKV